MGGDPRRSNGSDPLDRETLERVRAREPGAMNRFFDLYFDRVHSYAARLLRDPAQAEDLAQEAFLRMHGAIDRLDPERDPTPWVFTIVTNTIRDHWRSRHFKSSRRSVPLEEAWDLAAPESPGDPERAVERRETAATVRAAMGRLSPADREVLLLRSFQDLEIREIARVLGIAVDAVRQRHSRAVRRLGKALKANVETSE